MDKASERNKDAKECGDTDIGIHDYKAGGKRQQLNGLWNVVSEDVVGLPPTRLATNCYKKDDDKKKGGLLDILVEENDTRGPPLLNTSKPARVF
jgi:hypothetical protein